MIATVSDAIGAIADLVIEAMAAVLGELIVIGVALFVHVVAGGAS